MLGVSLRCLGAVFFPYRLFSPVAEYVTSMQKPKEIRMLHVGDMMFDRGVRVAMARGYEPLSGFVSSGLATGMDVVVGNLEGPIVEMPREDCQQKAYNFQFASTTASLLRQAGFTMLNVANNHSFDCYQKGVTATKQYVTAAGLDLIGQLPLENSYVIKEIRGKKFAFVGIDQTVAPVPVSSFYPLIQKLDTEVDMVIVHIHWGVEYKKTADYDTQQVFAYALVDHGADLIIGHHPHVVGSIEIYKQVPIFYSLGNFIFDQNTKETNEGIAVSVEVGDVVRYHVHPYVIKKTVPQFLPTTESNNICARFVSIPIDECTFTIHR